MTSCRSIFRIALTQTLTTLGGALILITAAELANYAFLIWEAKREG